MKLPRLGLIEAAHLRRRHVNGAFMRAYSMAGAPVPCAFLDLLVTFRGRRKGRLVVWWFEVD